MSDNIDKMKEAAQDLVRQCTDSYIGVPATPSNIQEWKEYCQQHLDAANLPFEVTEFRMDNGNFVVVLDPKEAD